MKFFSIPVLLSILYLAFGYKNGFAQTDTIFPKTVTHIVFELKDSLIAVNKTLYTDSIKNIEIFLGTDEKIWLCKKRDTGYVHLLLSEKFTKETLLKITETDLNEDGFPELLIHWDFLGKIEFLNVMVKGIWIWDWKNEVCFLDELTHVYEERFVRDQGIQFYAGCEREILLVGKKLTVSEFVCDVSLGFEALAEENISGDFVFDGKQFVKQ